MTARRRVSRERKPPDTEVERDGALLARRLCACAASSTIGRPTASRTTTAGKNQSGSPSSERSPQAAARITTAATAKTPKTWRRGQVLGAVGWRPGTGAGTLRGVEVDDAVITSSAESSSSAR